MPRPVISVLGLIVACTLSLCGNVFNQNTALYTISAISRGGYCLKGRMLAMALTLSLTVLIYLSTSGTCSFLDATLSIMPMSARLFLIHSNPPSPSILRTLKPLAWYALTTCCINVMIVVLDLLHINLAVPKCICLDTVITNGILLMAIMSMAIVTSPYFSNISLGIFFHV